MKHYSNILVETTLTSLVWAFTIIHFHTPSLGHDTSQIKSIQIKDWMLSFEGFNLEENLDLLSGLFYKKGKKKRLKKCVQRFSFKHWGSLCLVDMFSKLQISKISMGNQAIKLNFGCPLSIHSS